MRAAEQIIIISPLGGAGNTIPPFPAPLFSAPLTSSLALAAGTGSFTLTRATSGSYIASGGNVTQASSGNGRFTYDPRGAIACGIHIGAAFTNVIRQSEVFGTTWSPLNSNTVTSNTTVAPDGNTTADTNTAANGANALMRQNNTISASTAYAFSTFVKPGTMKLSGLRVSNQFNGVSSYDQYPAVDLVTNLPYWYAGSSGVTLDNRAVEYANGWIRQQVKVTSEASPNNLQDIAQLIGLAQTGAFVGTVPTGLTLILWGAALATAGVTPPYFPTTTVNVTQNADVLSIATSGNCPTNDFVVTLDWTPADWGMGTVYLWGSYVDANNSTQILHDGTSLIARRRIGGTNHDAKIAVAYDAWATVKVAASFSSTNGTQIYFQGTAGTLDATTTACQIASTMQIGADGNGANQANSAIANFKIYQ